MLSATALCLNAGGTENKAPIVQRMLDLYHVNPRPLNDQLCKDVLDDYLASIDARHMYFTAADIQQIKQSTSVMAGIQNSNPQFLNQLLDLYHWRLLWTDTLITGILKKPFDFSINETFTESNDSTPYATSDAELKERWRKLLKFETLHRITDLFIYDSTITKKEMLKRQPEQEKVVLKTEERKIKKVLNYPSGYESYMMNLFCNTLAQAYDPHSEFFPLTEKENFDNALNGDGYTFGFEIDDNDKGEVEITHISPGSAAWKCGELNQNDVLLQMQWEGQPVIDLAGADWVEVGDLLEADNRRQLKLTVHKLNGKNVTVSLQKEKATIEEDYLKSYILDGSYKIGYILLPGFYTEFENINGSNCANEVAREVNKLKKENISGLILDLRNNGGGSLDEASALTGLFINQGSFGFEKERTGKPHPIKDPSRSSLYDGPLLVMINGETASASELVAGALQDYNRAITVGSPSFGKATAQAVLPCDTTFNFAKATPESMDNFKSDFIKITMEKLYRVTGKSNQFNGVQPDIALPDIFTVDEERESTLKHALKPDTLKHAVSFNQWPALPLKELTRRSGERLNTANGFEVVAEARSLISSMLSTKTAPMPISFDQFFALTKKYGTGEMDLYRKLESDSSVNFKVANCSAEPVSLAPGPYDDDENKKVLSALVHDIYIDESFLILSDYIKLNK